MDLQRMHPSERSRCPCVYCLWGTLSFPSPTITTDVHGHVVKHDFPYCFSTSYICDKDAAAYNGYCWSSCRFHGISRRGRREKEREGEEDLERHWERERERGRVQGRISTPHLSLYVLYLYIYSLSISLYSLSSLLRARL